MRIWPLTCGLTCTIIVRQLSRTTASCPASTGYERSCAAVCAECVLKSFESGAPASLGQRRAAPAMTLLPGHLLASLHRMSGRTFPRPGHPITHPVAGARLNAPCAEIRLGARRGGGNRTGCWASFPTNTERHARWTRSYRVGPTVMPGAVQDVAVMVAVTAPAGRDGLAGQPPCLPTRWRFRNRR